MGLRVYRPLRRHYERALTDGSAVRGQPAPCTSRPAEGLAGPARRESRRGNSSRGVRTPCGRGPSAPSEAALTGASNARRGGGPCSAGPVRAEPHRPVRGVLVGWRDCGPPGTACVRLSEEKTAAPADAEWPLLSQLSGRGGEGASAAGAPCSLPSQAR